MYFHCWIVLEGGSDAGECTMYMHRLHSPLGVIHLFEAHHWCNAKIWSSIESLMSLVWFGVVWGWKKLLCTRMYCLWLFIKCLTWTSQFGTCEALIFETNLSIISFNSDVVCLKMISPWFKFLTIICIILIMLLNS